MRLAIGVYSDQDEPPATMAPGVKHLLSTGDVAHLSGCSPRWIVKEIHAGRIVPFAQWVKRRAGQWEAFSLFERAEVERYLANRGVPEPRPRQLSIFPLFTIRDGGKA